MSSNQLVLVLDAGPCNNIIVPLPSLIPGLLAHPSLPPFSAGSRERPSSSNFSQINILKPSSGSNKELGSVSQVIKVAQINNLNVDVNLLHFLVIQDFNISS
jgi:hypothetical protein